MDIKKLNPWNWFKHEDKQQNNKESIPVKRGDYLQTEQPVSDVMQLRREIDRLFNESFHGLPNLSRSPLLHQMIDDDFIPAFWAKLNVASDDKQYTIALEAPGMEQSDISIELIDRVMYIKGHKQQETEEKDTHYYRVERHYGTFERVLAIPDDGDTEEISATMKNGVLTVGIPRKKMPASDVKKINIDS